MNMLLVVGATDRLRHQIEEHLARISEIRSTIENLKHEVHMLSIDVEHECDLLEAIVEDKDYKTKLRMYQVEEMITTSFIKINQGCIANISKINHFKTSFGGSVQVIFNNGHIDYISRRELQNVKRRLGI